MNEHLSPPPIEMPSVTEPILPSAEEVRQEHIKHEAAVKSISMLYYLPAAFLFLAGISSVLNIVLDIEGAAVPELIGVATFMVCFGTFLIFVGRELRRLKAWTRIPIGIMSGFGLLAFPFGTLINGYILYLVFSKKGATVFSEEYQQVIEATPDIKSKTSIVIWIFLGLLVLLFAFIILAVLFSFVGQLAEPPV